MAMTMPDPTAPPPATTSWITEREGARSTRSAIGDSSIRARLGQPFQRSGGGGGNVPAQSVDRVLDPPLLRRWARRRDDSGLVDRGNNVPAPERVRSLAQRAHRGRRRGQSHFLERGAVEKMG